MEIVPVVLAFIFLAAGILGSVLPALPGPPLSYAGLLLMKWSGYGNFSLFFLIVWAVITVVITIMDNFLPAIMAKQFGGSRAASIGSFIGLVVGIFVFPPWGMIIGPFLGALIGELIYSRNNSKAFKAAFGAFLAFIAGSGAKLAASAVMLFYAIRAVV